MSGFPDISIHVVTFKTLSCPGEDQYGNKLSFVKTILD